MGAGAAVFVGFAPLQIWLEAICCLLRFQNWKKSEEKIGGNMHMINFIGTLGSYVYRVNFTQVNFTDTTGVYQGSTTRVVTSQGQQARPSGRAGQAMGHVI
jgi:hypothetical protein